MHFAPRTSFNTLWVGMLINASACLAAFAQVGPSTCGSLRPPGQFGPYDYRTDKSKLAIVEDYHFPPVVEALIGGSVGSTSIAGNIAYTLRAFPNHHRALMAMMRYGEKMKSPQPTGAPLPVECYFERALRFRPDDTIVRMIYATFLTKNKRSPEAIQQLELATASAGDNAITHHNIGLIYFDLKDYDKALDQAHKAIALGFPQPPLRDQLQSLGKWIEPSASDMTAPVTAPKNESADLSSPTLTNLPSEANKR